MRNDNCFALLYSYILIYHIISYHIISYHIIDIFKLLYVYMSKRINIYDISYVHNDNILVRIRTILKEYQLCSGA